MLLVDTETKALIQDVELKTKISKSRPYGEWLKQQVSYILVVPAVFLIQGAVNLTLRKCF